MGVHLVLASVVHEVLLVTKVSKVLQVQWVILADAVFLVSQVQSVLKVLLVSPVAREKMVLMVRRVNQVSAASPQLDQVQSVHVVLLEPRVTKAPLASAFRVKPVHKVHLVSLVKLVFQSRVTSEQLVKPESANKLALHKLKYPSWLP